MLLGRSFFYAVGYFMWINQHFIIQLIEYIVSHEEFFYRTTVCGLNFDHEQPSNYWQSVPEATLGGT